MKSRLKTYKFLKIKQKQLNYQINLALKAKISFSTLFPPTKLNIALNVARAIENTGRKWYLLHDMESEWTVETNKGRGVGGAGGKRPRCC